MFNIIDITLSLRNPSGVGSLSASILSIVVVLVVDSATLAAVEVGSATILLIEAMLVVVDDEFDEDDEFKKVVVVWFTNVVEVVAIFVVVELLGDTLLVVDETDGDVVEFIIAVVLTESLLDAVVDVGIFEIIVVAVF